MVLGLPAILGGRRGVLALAKLWGAVSVWLLEATCGLRVEYRGIENIPAGAVLIASKHQSFLETFALLKYAPDFAIILKRQLTYIPLFGLYLIVSRQIAIDRAQGRQALQQVIDAVRPVFAAGRQVFIYPEGTRRLPGAPPRYKSGVAAIYAGNEVPCLPVALSTGLFWRRRGLPAPTGRGGDRISPAHSAGSRPPGFRGPAAERRSSPPATGSMRKRSRTIRRWRRSSGMARPGMSRTGVSLDYDLVTF